MAAHTHTANHAGGAAPASGGHDDHEEQSFIKTPKQLIIVVLLALLVPIVLIILLANFVTAGHRDGAGAGSMEPKAVEARISPVAGFELIDANAPKVVRAGEEVYKAVCSACHMAGVAGAPKVGDEAAWGPRIAQGYEAMLASALKGKGAMPAQGGGDFSDLEIGKALVYMADKSGGKLEEPKAAAEPAAAAAGDTAKQ